MQFQDIIQTRRSVRYFDGQPIARDTLIAIVKEAQCTPSWANSQPWQVYIATGQTLEGIKQEHHATSSQGIRGQAEFSTQHREAWADRPRRNMGNWSRQIGAHLGEEHGAEYGDAQRDLFNAAAIVYLTIPHESSLWSVLDLGAFSQTLMSHVQRNRQGHRHHVGLRNSQVSKHRAQMDGDTPRGNPCHRHRHGLCQ